jgi:hypothetical protein
MNTSLPSRLSALGLAFVTTVSLMAGIGHLAAVDTTPADLARADAGVQRIVVTAPRHEAG